MPLSDVIQEIIQRHADGLSRTEAVLDCGLAFKKRRASDEMSLIFLGISFREWNAGSSIDQDMTEKGFDVDVIVKRETGFIFGGNQYNCGVRLATIMDI